MSRFAHENSATTTPTANSGESCFSKKSNKKRVKVCFAQVNANPSGLANKKSGQKAALCWGEVCSEKYLNHRRRLAYSCHLHIALGSFNVAVPHHVLNIPAIGSALQHVGTERVAKHMWVRFCA